MTYLTIPQVILPLFLTHYKGIKYFSLGRVHRVSRHPHAGQIIRWTALRPPGGGACENRASIKTLARQGLRLLAAACACTLWSGCWPANHEGCRLTRRPLVYFYCLFFFL